MSVLKKMYIYVISLFSINLYSFVGFPKIFYSYVSTFLLTILILVCFYKWIVNDDKNKNKLLFESQIIGLLIVVFILNILGAYFHGQGFIDSFQASRTFVFLLLYFVMFYWHVESEYVIKIIISIGIGWMIIMYIQQLTPIRWFSSYDLGLNNAEGSTNQFGKAYRLIFDGAYWCLFSYFYFFSKALETHKFIHALLSIVLFVAFYLTFTRNFIMLEVITTLCILYFYRNKITMGILSVVLIIVLLFFLNSELFIHPIIEKSLNNLAEGSSYSRWSSINFYLLEYWDSILYVFFGNGSPQLTNYNYGAFIKTCNLKGLIRADVGIIGELSQYGIVYIILLCRIYYKIFFIKNCGIYLKVFILSSLLMPLQRSMLSSSTLLFVLVLYVLEIQYVLNNGKSLSTH